jgi:uncharacterized protein
MAGTVPKPGYICDRVAEWQALAEFATDDRLGATLGVVSGRRRQGKTLLLESMCEELGGLYFTVPEDMPASEHLRRLAEALGAFTGGLPPRLDSWDQAIEALFGLGAAGRPVLVVLDEFPYMARSASGLPSIIQHALSPRGKARTGSRTRLILCGSSISFMGQLVSGSAALFGRARLSLMVRAFDFRAAARFWGVSHDLPLAAALFAMVGGTPAYIEYASGVPASLGELDEWVTRNLLNSTNMLFRQPRMLLSEDSAFSQIGMYGTVLSAIAEGSRTVSGIAQRVGGSTSDVNHYVKGLADGGFLTHVPDAFRANRAEYQITDALIRFHHAIVYPNWSRLDLYRPEGQLACGRSRRRRSGRRSWGRHSRPCAGSGPRSSPPVSLWVASRASFRTACSTTPPGGLSANLTSSCETHAAGWSPSERRCLARSSGMVTSASCATGQPAPRTEPP